MVEGQQPAKRETRQGLWAYNVRILLGNSYWLIVTPVVGGQLVLFWNMAVVSASTPALAVRTIELLAPILGAFLCAHALAPEQGKVGELVFVRPVSIERVLILRLLAILAFVIVVMSPVLMLFIFRVEAFPLAAAVAASLPGTLLLSVLALAAGNALRQPLLGFAVAGAFWALEVATGGYFNALVSLQSYADWLAGRPMSELWLINKLVLAGLAVVVYLVVRRTLGQPAAPRRLRTTAVRTAAVVAIAVAYLATGAGYKLAYGLRHEQELGTQSHLWYQLQFGGYGPLPVARLFGPAFPLYLQADLTKDLLSTSITSTPLVTPVDVSRLRLLLARYPKSIWADNAQLDIALHVLKQRPRETGLLIGRQAGQEVTAQRVIDQDITAARPELEALVDRYPRSPFGPLALSELAGIGLAQLDFPLAISSYERLIRDYPGAPDAYTAGLKLNAYYLAGGQGDKALAAADVAAAVARWDVQADALFAAGRAAGSAEKIDTARDRYQRAKEAAREAGERSIAGARSPSHLNKAEMFTRANAVISASDRALASLDSKGTAGAERGPGPGAAAVARVSGRAVVDGGTAAGARVAMGTADGSGFPSPFAGGPAAAASAGTDGRFALKLPEGTYPALAVSLDIPESRVDWRKEMAVPNLPVRVERPSVDLGEIRVAMSPPLRVEREGGGQRRSRSGSRTGGGGRRGSRTEPGGGRGGGERRRTGRGAVEPSAVPEVGDPH